MSEAIRCIFCLTPAHFERQMIVSIKIEHTEDGAGVIYHYWAHENCLPEAIADKGAYHYARH